MNAYFPAAAKKKTVWSDGNYIQSSSLMVAVAPLLVLLAAVVVDRCGTDLATWLDRHPQKESALVHFSIPDYCAMTMTLRHHQPEFLLHMLMLITATIHCVSQIGLISVRWFGRSVVRSHAITSEKCRCDLSTPWEASTSFDFAVSALVLPSSHQLLVMNSRKQAEQSNGLLNFSVTVLIDRKLAD